ncbi:hypothetical protein QQF64_021641 [Cirrhinus molitorella]|uniref:Uncharacterized protein n=1 Tax=Cirrhinus molitorella TaxID=172907 RepID=A0ABR3L659_9TELE
MARSDTYTHTRQRSVRPSARHASPTGRETPRTLALLKASSVSAGRPPAQPSVQGLLDSSWAKIQSATHPPEPTDPCGTFAPASIQLGMALSLQSVHFGLFFSHFPFSTRPSVPLRSLRLVVLVSPLPL